MKLRPLRTLRRRGVSGGTDMLPKTAPDAARGGSDSVWVRERTSYRARSQPSRGGRAPAGEKVWHECDSAVARTRPART